MRDQTLRKEYFKKWREENKAYIEEYAKTHRIKRNKQRRAWASLNPESGRKAARKQNLRIRFNMTLEEYDSLLIKQRYVCKICKQPEIFIEGNSKKLKNLTVDHDHLTGQIRGLLCHRCNLGLGHFLDNIESLSSAINYLDEARNELRPQSIEYARQLAFDLSFPKEDRLKLVYR